MYDEHQSSRYTLDRYFLAAHVHVCAVNTESALCLILQCTAVCLSVQTMLMHAD